jgi:hypothetical protein
VPFPGALNLGAPTGCRTDGLAAIAAIANVGNGGFGFVGTRAPANAGASRLLSMGALPAPLQVLGIDVLVNPNLGASLFVLANSLGTATLGFAIPNDVGYLGQGFYTQFLWLDGTCANGVSASNAVFASILPEVSHPPPLLRLPPHPVAQQRRIQESARCRRDRRQRRPRQFVASRHRRIG